VSFNLPRARWSYPENLEIIALPVSELWADKQTNRQTGIHTKPFRLFRLIRTLQMTPHLMQPPLNYSLYLSVVSERRFTIVRQSCDLRVVVTTRRAVVSKLRQSRATDTTSQQVSPGRTSCAVVAVVSSAARIARGAQLVDIHVTLIASIYVLTRSCYWRQFVVVRTQRLPSNW